MPTPNKIVTRKASWKTALSMIGKDFKYSPDLLWLKKY